MLVGLVFWASVVAAFFDWRYRKAGGAGPTRRHRALLVGATGLCVMVLVTLSVLGAPAYVVGQSAAALISAVVGFWELSRWRIRRANPLARP